MKWHGLFALSIVMIFTATAFAGDDPSIKGEIRTGVQQAMVQHISDNTLGEQYVIYDVVTGELKKLEFAELHKGIVKKGEFYVSCADFIDAQKRKYDIDFLVARKGEDFRVFQALVHSIDGEKRAYHLEEAK